MGVEVLDLLGKGIIGRFLQRQQQRAVQTDAGRLFVRLCRHLTAAGAQPHKIILRKAEHGAQHGGSQIDILRGVVDDLEQGDEGADVGRKHQVLPGIGIYRDAPGGQCLHIGRELGACCQQDAAILVPHRAGGTALPHRLPGRNQLRDALRDPACIGFGLVVRQKLHLYAALIFPGRTADQTLPVPVGGIAQFRGHELLKEIVDARHHLRRGAEVCIQRQQSVRARGVLRRAGTGFCARQQRPAVQLLPEDARLCLPEAVDALLQVAYKEEVIPRRGGKAAVKGILQGVRILIFVHHHGGVVLPDVLAQGGGRALRGAQQPQGKVLKIAEFQQLALPLSGCEPDIEVPHGGKQRPQPGQGDLPVGLGFSFGAADELGHLLEQGGGFVRAGLDLRLVVTAQTLFHALQAGGFLHAQHIGGEQVVQRVPLPGSSQLLRLRKEGGGFFQPCTGFLVFFRYRGLCLCPGRGGLFLLSSCQFLIKIRMAVGQRCRQQLPRSLGAAGGLGQQQVVPAGGSKAVFLLVRGKKFIQLAVIIRQCPQKIVDLQNGIARRFICASLAVQVCKGAEIRVAVGVFQRFGQRRPPQQLHSAGVCRGKIRRDIQRLKVLVQQVQTKSVNGADGRALQQHPLAAQHGVAGLQLAAVQQRLSDAGAQLCRRRVGKGDDEQPVGVDRVLRVGDQLHRPLGQHSGLAAACGCAYQQRTAPVCNSGLLRRGPFGSAHGCSSSSSFSSSGSKGFAGASSARSCTPVSWQQIKL